MKYLAAEMSDVKRPSLLSGLLRMKCPACRRGDVFVQRHILPLKGTVKMPDDCPNCGYRFKNERNNGPGINYALTVMIFFLNLCWYWPIFGLSYKDNSVYWFLTTSTVVVILLQPWLMRISRVVYLYLFDAFTEK